MRFRRAFPEGRARRILCPGAVNTAPELLLPWAYTGVLTFDIDANGAVTANRMRPAIFPGGGALTNDARSVLLGDSVFFYSGGRWYGQRIDGAGPMAGPF